jgi:hypothetical protein
MICVCMLTCSSGWGVGLGSGDCLRLGCGDGHRGGCAGVGGEVWVRVWVGCMML